MNPQPGTGNFRQSAKHYRKRILTALLFPALALFGGCRHEGHSPSTISREDSVRICANIATYRIDADIFFRSHPQSPFRRDTSAGYTGLRWFDPDLRFVYRSKLYRYASPERRVIMGTRGEERKMLHYGYFLIDHEGEEHRLDVYVVAAETGAAASGRNLSLWFTDGTTGNQTYPVGRYLDVGQEASDPDHMYEIDFNLAYNPYCAYSSSYTCPIPPRENRLPFAVTAGELTYRRH